MGWKSLFLRSAISLTLICSSYVPAGYSAAGNVVSSPCAVLRGIELGKGALSFSWDNPSGGSSDMKNQISYFYTALSVPEKDWWVNLGISLSEKDIIGYGLQDTKLGKVLLDTDLNMKRLVNNALDPGSDTGSAFWEEALDMGLSGFYPRFWIVPADMRIISNGASAEIKSAKIKVKAEIESDMPEGKKAQLNALLKKYILPRVEREINKGSGFSEFRKAYNAMILASWAKRHGESAVSRIMNSYSIPDTGVQGINRHEFLVAFARRYIFSSNESDDFEIVGGGFDGTNLAEKVADSEEMGDPRENNPTMVDIPQMVFNGKLKAEEIGIKAPRALVYGDVRFNNDVSPDIVGPNVLIVNTTKDPFILTKEVLQPFVQDNEWFKGIITGAIIIKTPKGIETFSLVPDLNNAEMTMKLFDTAMKAYSFMNNKLPRSIRDKGLFFAQRPKEEVGEYALPFLRELIPFVEFLYPEADIASSDIREAGMDKTKQKKSAYYAMIKPKMDFLVEKRYFWRWVGEKGPRKGQIEKGKELFDLAKSFLDKKDLSRLKEFTKGLKALNFKGDAIDYLDKQIVEEMKEAGEKGDSKLFAQWAALRKMVFAKVRSEVEEVFGKYKVPSSELSVAEQLTRGKMNFNKMESDLSEEIFGDETIDSVLSGLNRSVPAKLLKDIREVLRDETVQYAYKMGEIKRSNMFKRLSQEQREKVETIFALKGFLFQHRKLNDTYKQIEENIKTGKINPNRKKGIRVAHYPMKGDPWHKGHILIVASLLATGKVDKVIVTVDNGDYRKPKLSAGAIRGPISDRLLTTLFGPELVELSYMPFQDPKYFNMTGEEFSPYLARSVIARYKKKGIPIIAWNYGAGSDHANYMSVKNLKKLEKKKKWKELHEILKRLNTKGISVGFDDKFGFFYEKVELVQAQKQCPGDMPRSDGFNGEVYDALMTGDIDEAKALLLRQEYGLPADFVEEVIDALKSGKLDRRDMISIPAISALLPDEVRPKETTKEAEGFLEELNNSKAQAASKNPGGLLLSNVL